MKIIIQKLWSNRNPVVNLPDLPYFFYYFYYFLPHLLSKKFREPFFIPDLLTFLPYLLDESQIFTIILLNLPVLLDSK
jgi:hypothetical protein